MEGGERDRNPPRNGVKGGFRERSYKLGGLLSWKLHEKNMGLMGNIYFFTPNTFFLGRGREGSFSVSERK